MQEIKGLDLSFSRAGLEWWERRYGEGYRVMFQCLWTGGSITSAPLWRVAPANILDAAEAGFICGGYANAAPWANGETCFVGAKEVAGDAWPMLSHFAVDIEIGVWNGQDIRPADVNWMIELGRDEGKEILTYSADWFVGFWAMGLPGTPTFPANYWYARYDGDPAIGQPLYPLGPVAGKQWGGREVEGVTIDENTFDAALFQREQETFMALTDDEQTDLKNRVATIASFIEEMKSAGLTVPDLVALKNRINSLSAAGTVDGTYEIKKKS